MKKFILIITTILFIATLNGSCKKKEIIPEPVADFEIYSEGEFLYADASKSYCDEGINLVYSWDLESDYFFEVDTLKEPLWKFQLEPGNHSLSLLVRDCLNGHGSTIKRCFELDSNNTVILFDCKFISKK
jgi:hypothetical protein